MGCFCPFLRFLTARGAYQEALPGAARSQMEHPPRTLLRGHGKFRRGSLFKSTGHTGTMGILILI